MDHIHSLDQCACPSSLFIVYGVKINMDIMDFYILIDFYKRNRFLQELKNY